MVLYPEKMSRVRIIGSNSRRHSIISSIHDAGFLQLEPVDPAIEKILDRGVSGDQYRKLSTLLQKFRSYEMILPPIEVKSRMGMIPLDKLLEEAEKINIGSDLESLKDSETDIQGELKEISMRLYALDLIEGLNYDLSIYNNSFVTSYVAIAKEEKIQPELIKQRIPEASVFPLQSGNYIVSIPENLESEFGKAAADQSFDLLHIPVMSGSPSEYRSMLLDKRKNAEEALKVVRNDLMDMSKTYYEKVVQYREALEIEARKLDVSEKLSSTKNAFVMEGWIPSKRIDELKGTVDRASAGASVVSLVETDEEPPTLFNNPRRFRLFEFFVRFYSLPQSTEFDPTLIFGIIFPIFFGIMVGDWGYGLIILVGAIWLVRRIDHPRANSHIPKKLSSFALTVLGKNPLRILGKTLIPGSILAIIVGLMFNNFFGFPLLPVTLFQTSTGFSGAHIGAFPPTPIVIFHVSIVIPKLLLLSGYIGLAMVTFGLILGFINETRRGHRRGSVGKIGWILLAWGIAIFGLNLIHHDTSLNPAVSLSTPIAVALIIAGLIVVIATEKARGAMEIPSIISHVLSYTRILGILLASVVLAQVIDLIFMKGVEKSPLLAVVGIIILIFGQLFNLVIAIFEPGIQGARLLYVEFFSKFYNGNGKYFRPFRSVRKYTVENEEK
jgi:V/A-type H+-transporting ATPase subunit I